MWLCSCVLLFIVAYYEKEMRNQILTPKRSSQAENSKFSILTNELARRFEMMHEGVKDEEKVSNLKY